MPRPPRQKLEEMFASCACLNARRVARLLTQQFDDRLRITGLRATQLPFLVALGLEDGRTVADLADQVVMDASSASRKVADLERKGWVRAVAGEDRRSRQVWMTSAGLAVLRQAIPLWNRAQAEASTHLGSSDSGEVLQVFADAVENLGA